VLETRHGEVAPGLVLQIGQRCVAAGIAELKGGAVDAGVQLVPLGLGRGLDVGEARAVH
jgi:hypothetical protein